MRDQAQKFAEAGCVILGISFDTPAENLAFVEAEGFPFTLLSDESKEVGALYDVLRAPDDPFVDYPQRISYLVDPNGEIVTAYEVADPSGHAAAVLVDLAAGKR